MTSCLTFSYSVLMHVIRKYSVKPQRICTYFLRVFTCIAYWHITTPLYITPPPLSLFSFLSFRLSFPLFPFLLVRGFPLENVTVPILFYAVLHLHEGTGKLRKTCADTVRLLTRFVFSPQSKKCYSSKY